MADHRTTSLGLMGKFFDSAGAGTVIIGDVQAIEVDIDTPEIEFDVECD